MTSRMWRLFPVAMFVAVAALFALVYPLIADLVTLVVLSVVLTYALKPAVDGMEGLGLGRTAAILTVFAVLTAAVVGMVAALAPVAVDEAAILSRRMEEVNLADGHRRAMEWLEAKVPGVTSALQIDRLDAEVVWRWFREWIGGHWRSSYAVIAGVLNVVTLTVMAPVLVFFFLRDGRRFSKSIIARVPNRFFEMTLSLVHRIDSQIGAYIRGVMLEALAVWLLSWGAFEVMGLRFALLVGLGNGLLNVIPFFGPLLALMITGALTLLTYQPAGVGLIWTVVILAGVQFIDNWVFKPLILSRTVEVHPVVVLLAILIGGRVGGPLGMFLAIPVYAVMQVVIVDFYTHLKQYRVI